MIRGLIEEEMEDVWFKRLCQFKDVCLQGNVYVNKLRVRRRYTRDNRWDNVLPIRSPINP